MRYILNELKLNIKNTIGWKSNRKIIVFAVDDYGNVRLHSKKAVDNLDRNGLKPKIIFDLYDSLETEDDLTGLFEALSSVKDKNGNHACFTPYSLPANINFEKIIDEGFQNYSYELLPDTYQKVYGHERVYKLWQEGFEKKIFMPQFHGREHLNVKTFNKLLENKNKSLLINLENRSYSRIEGENNVNNIYPMAFYYESYEENIDLKEIISEGLVEFKKVFAQSATNFMPPGAMANSVLHNVLYNKGIRYLDSAIINREIDPNNKTKYSFRYTGKKNNYNQYYFVRNVVFEANHSDIDSVGLALKQIEAAFRWNKPAIISSHRVNYCGNIDEKNRHNGLTQLRVLLKKITERWPEVEFLSAGELGKLISNT